MLQDHIAGVTLFYIIFKFIILYCDRIYYMYRALREVVRGGGGGIKARDKALQR
jgi:hypothetical protein